MRYLNHIRPVRTALCVALAGAAIFASQASAAISNRYSFNDGTANDSVSGQNGIVYGTNASFSGGELNLANNPSPGSNSNNDGTGAGGWVDLPNGLVSAAAAGGASGQVSIEMWVTMNSNGNWRALFSAGRSNGGEGISDSAGGQPYVQIIPRTGDGGRGNDFRVTTSSSAGEGPTTWVDDLGDGNGTDLQIGRKEHVLAVLDQSGGLPGSLTVYRNGALMGTSGISGALDLVNFAADEVNVWLGRSQWNDGMVDARFDELRIYNTAVTPQQALANAVFGPNVTNAAAIPSIEVDKTTGAITLKNNSAAPLNLEYYAISSTAGAMNVGGWNSLDQQNYNAVDGPDDGSVAGDSPGEGWDAAGGSNANLLNELFLGSAGSLLAPNATLSLGNAYNTSVFGGADGDLQFEFGVNGGALFEGTVSYVTSGGTPGNFNNDTKVDGADFLVWQRGFGAPYGPADLTAWRNNYGAGVPATAAAGAIPEPASASLALGLLAAAWLGVRKRV